jgi:hypothetical protein
VILAVSTLVATGGCASSGHSSGSTSTTVRPFTPPTMVVDPSSALTDGQTVQVHVSGFSAKVFLSECATPGDANLSGCGLQLAAQPFIVAGNDWTASGTFRVSRTASQKPYSEAVVACSKACVLVATGGAGGGRLAFATAPLSYNQKLWMRDLLKGATYPPS